LLWLAAKRWAGKAPWITFLAGTRAMVLAFLAGADLGLNVFRAKWKESTAVGLVGFFSSTGAVVTAPRGFRQVFLQIPARMKTGFAPPRLAWRM
jgi:hypothetical protein